jgi:hypothetical protein
VLIASFGILAIAPAVVSYGWLNAPLALGAAGIIHAIGSSAISPAAAALVAEGSPPDMIAGGGRVRAPHRMGVRNDRPGYLVHGHIGCESRVVRPRLVASQTLTLQPVLALGSAHF